MDEKINTFNERIVEISKTNFYALRQLYLTNNWKWATLKRNGKYVCDVPTVSEMIEFFNELIRDLRRHINENGFPKTTTGVSSGRFNIEVDSDGWVDFSVDVHP